MRNWLHRRPAGDDDYSSLMERLKSRTSTAHERLEAAFDLDSISSSLARYRNILTRFYGFHAVWEPAAERALAASALMRGRRKTHLLERDLHALGMSDAEVARLPLCEQAGPLANAGAALGSMYVMEGSTLGGAFIAARVERAFGIGPFSGCAYFRSYGRDVARMWATFAEHVESASSPDADPRIIAGAQDTFACLHTWLCEAR